MFLRTGFLFFSVQILTIFLRKRQLHRKFNHILRAPCLYRTTVQLHYLPGNGQAQPSTAAAAPCSIQPVELLKDTGKLLLWYGIAVVPKADHRFASPHLRRYGNFGVCVAIKHSIMQQVIKNPLDLMAAKNNKAVGSPSTNIHNRKTGRHPFARHQPVYNDIFYGISLLLCIPVTEKITHSAIFTAWSPIRSKYLAIIKKSRVCSPPAGFSAICAISSFFTFAK